MNSILADIYSTVIPAAPYVIAAYVLVMVAFFIFVFVLIRRVGRAERTLDALEEELDATETDDARS
ncbi:MAG: hypothetical protein LUD25_01320 [Coriobacteriaceae bacterium]|nr:hypothetical protein [Coriobacteriaceae bacterium]